MKTRATIEAELTAKRNRLELYLKREAEMLDGGVQSYGIGSRNLARYNTDLSQIRDAIKQLEKEIANLEGALNGQKPRKPVGVVPRDWEHRKRAPPGAFFIGIGPGVFAPLLSAPCHLLKGGEQHQQEETQQPTAERKAAASPRQ